MKQVIMSIVLMLVALTATAQDNQRAALNEKYFNAKVSELVYRLDISDEQKAKFVPVYRRYTEEMRATMRQRTRQSKPATDEERLARTKQRMERQQQAQAVRLKYVDEFSTVLSAQQVSKFFEVENSMQRKLMERRTHHRKGMKARKPMKQRKPVQARKDKK